MNFKLSLSFIEKLTHQVQFDSLMINRLINDESASVLQVKQNYCFEKRNCFKGVRFLALFQL